MEMINRNNYLNLGQTADQQQSSFESMLSVEARIKKNLQAQLLMKISSPKFIVKAADGLPLILLIIFKCLYKEESKCDLTLIQVAASLGVSPATVTNWRKKLEVSKLITSKRNRGSITFYLNDDIAQLMRISDTCLDEKQFKEQQVTKLSSELISSLLIRVDRLEEKVFRMQLRGER